jgi:hypothetical protein
MTNKDAERDDAVFALKELVRQHSATVERVGEENFEQTLDTVPSGVGASG